MRWPFDRGGYVVAVNIDDIGVVAIAGGNGNQYDSGVIIVAGGSEDQYRTDSDAS